MNEHIYYNVSGVEVLRNGVWVKCHLEDLDIEDHFRLIDKDGKYISHPDTTETERILLQVPTIVSTTPRLRAMENDSKRTD